MELAKKIILILMVLCLWAGSAWGATVTVCSSGCDETTLQDAFDNNDLNGGDIVEVQADTVGGTTRIYTPVTWGSNDGGASSASRVTLRGRAGDTVILSGGTEYPDDVRWKDSFYR